MRPQNFHFRILRFKPGSIDPPRYQVFTMALDSERSVLDGLEQIRLTRDKGLMYRHCCHHASCGTCACTINGTPALACTTRLADLDGNTVELAPLENFTCMGDLVVDMRGFFADFNCEWSMIKPVKADAGRRPPAGVSHFTRMENCIECGCCVSACPVIRETDAFMGPAALAALNNESTKAPDRRNSLLELAAGPHGVDGCRRHLACSRVCPSGVYPARHIADLRKTMQKRTDNRK
jgi:succinate dehydrogenase / fumarate reductase iron-sulfur subunit